MNNARTDANHAEIRDGLRDLGYTVIDTSKFGRGFPDLLVVSRTNQIILLEVKSPGGKLSAAEKKFHELTRRAAVHVVYSIEEAISFLVAVDYGIVGTVRNTPPQEGEATCYWEYSTGVHGTSWNTSCDYSVDGDEIAGGSPEYANYKYCPFCGKSLHQIKEAKDEQHS
jgi:hypothetical protein